MTVRLLFLVGSILLALAVPVRLYACSPTIAQPSFWFGDTPDDRDRFLAGELGVLTQEFARPYLYVAYRHLSGLGVDEGSRAALADLWHAPEPDAWRYDAVRAWDRAVSDVAGRRQYSYSRPLRVQKLDRRSTSQYGGYFVNCLESAFRSAAATLRERAEHYGAEAPEVRAWIEAQDVVFSNCGHDRAAIPEPLDETADPLARADRAYQIAAAHFYALNFEVAGERFRSISADRSSPWSDLSAYLQARCHIRSSSVGTVPLQEGLASARDLLKAILADPNRSAVHAMSRRLLQYVELRVDPEFARDQLHDRLMALHLESSVRQDMIDYEWLLAKASNSDVQNLPELDRWILSFGNAPNWNKAIELAARAAGESEMWRVPTFVTATRQAPWAAEAVALARVVPATSPAYASARYHLARLQGEAGKYSEARDGLAQAFAELRDRLSTGDRSRFALLLAELAPTLEERIELGRRRPVQWKREKQSAPASAERAPYVRRFDERTLPADVAINALNLTSTSHLVRYLAGEAISSTLRERLAPLVWTRAVLLGEEALALAIEPIVIAAAPELTVELEHYRNAAPGDERMMSAALSILRFPGLRPTLRHGYGRFGVSYGWDYDTPVDLREFSSLRDNWWCWNPIHGIAPRTVATLDAENRAEAEESLGLLGALASAPTHLGYIVLGWAENHPDDPRVPEALHRVVRGSRICGGGEISRVAFQTLHRRYPSNRWARKTPHWYE